MKQISSVFQVDNSDTIIIRNSAGDRVARGNWYMDRMLQWFDTDGNLLDGFTAWIEEER